MHGARAPMLAARARPRAAQRGLERRGLERAGVDPSANKFFLKALDDLFAVHANCTELVGISNTKFNAR